MINPFAKLHNEKWLYPVSTLSAVLGFMMVAAWLTDQNRQYRSLAPDQRQREVETIVGYDKYLKLQEEVDSLRKKATSLEKALSENGKGSAALNSALQDNKAFAGLTELEGEGIEVTLVDNPAAGPMPGELDIIHDYDLLKVSNELFSAGAEAISINGQRLVTMSSIRCAGPTILVDGIKVAAPFKILAIGDAKVLDSAFRMAGGVMAELSQSNPKMVSIRRMSQIRVPAYLGSTQFKKAALPKAAAN
jgi:uncharacterized protein YlxW (UPF0749 family)